mgnify:CR=1 FL=1
MKAADANRGLTLGYLQEYLTYDANTGIFRWREIMRASQRGKVAGNVNWAGYRKIKLRGQLCAAHRLAWLYVYGEWPRGLIDHIDENRDNTAISNLRIATSAQNSARRKSVRSISPSRGVFPHGAGFVVRIHHAGKRHYLGYFPKLDDARAAYEAKAKEIHGDFAFCERMPLPINADAGLYSGVLSFGA